MDILTALGHSAAIAFSLSLAFTGFMIYAGVGDIPETRSSHDYVTPTAGGVGLTAALGGALLCIGLFYPYLLEGPVLAKILSIGLGFAVLGLADDVYGGGSGFKMLLIAILSGLAVWSIGPAMALPLGAGDFALPYGAGFAGSVLWVFVVVNVINFIDGSNGMMGLSLFIAALILTGLALVSGAWQSALLSGALAAGLLGLLPYNLRHKARIFSGDVGSLFAGFIFAAAVLLLVSEAPKMQLLYAGPILILPFLTDVFITLLRRVRRGENLMRAHSLIQVGLSHVRVAIFYAVATIACALIAVNGIVLQYIGSAWVFAGVVALASVIYVLILIRLKRAS